MGDGLNALPRLLPKEMLRALLRPAMKSSSFNNWLHARMNDPDPFPRGVRLGGARALAWREDEVVSWLDRRARGGRFTGKRRG